MDKSWMQKSRVSLEYIKGMKGFIEFAFGNAANHGKILCPCVKCVNIFWRTHREVVDRLVCEGIMLNYTHWRFHGETSFSSTPDPATSTHDDTSPRNDMHQKEDKSTVNEQSVIEIIKELQAPESSQSSIVSGQEHTG